MRQLCSQKAQAHKTATILYAKAMLDSQGPVEIRKAAAKLAAADSHALRENGDG